MTGKSGFKEWLKLHELKERKPSFFAAMKDLGIPPDVLQDNPLIFAHGVTGNNSKGSGVDRDLGVYNVVGEPEERKDGSYAARLKNMDDPSNKTQKRYRLYKGQWVLLPRDKNDEYPEDDDEYTVQGDELEDIPTQFLKNKGAGTATGLPGQGMGGL